MDELIKVNNEIVALIPARGGSKRIKNKNLRSINGKPLIGYAIEHALSSTRIDEVYVSTDSEVIADVGKNYGAKIPFLRPEELAKDSSTDYDVFKHFLEWYKNENGVYPKLIVQIRATSPLREPMMIDKAIEIIENDSKADSLRSVSKPHQTPYKMWRIENNFLKSIIEYDNEGFYDMPTQSLPTVYGQDGFVDIIKPRTIIELKSMAGENIIGFTEHKMAIDIDNIKDLHLAELIMKDYNNSYSIINKGNIGIIQGRLSESYNNKLQNFPDDWLKEFGIARKCGYSHIELFRDKEYNPKNPLWNKEDAEIKKIVEEQINSGVVVRSICDDYILNCDFLEINMRELQKLIDLLILAKKLEVNQVIYPLMEKAQINELSKRKKAADIMKILADIAKEFGITINIETNLEGKMLTSFLKDIGRDNVKICLDTGNLLYENIDPVKQILELENSIGHIHIKDKDENGNNVILTTGQLNLYQVIIALIKIKYDRYITFETTRGNNCIDTAINHVNLFNRLLKEII
ncbi:hypothetical protein AN1V17_01130 [Vallitalea sediminicola]